MAGSVVSVTVAETAVVRLGGPVITDAGKVDVEDADAGDGVD